MDRLRGIKSTTETTTTTRRAVLAGATPDATAIEEALLRIRVAANVVDTIAGALRGQGERHGNTLVLVASDIEEAVEAIKPVVRHLLDEENRRDAA